MCKISVESASKRNNTLNVQIWCDYSRSWPDLISAFSPSTFAPYVVLCMIQLALGPQYNIKGWVIGLDFDTFLKSLGVFRSLQILKLKYQHVWRRRCCSCRWQWLRHVQSWFRWWWRPQGCLPLHCWSSPPSSMTKFFNEVAIYKI